MKLYICYEDKGTSGIGGFDFTPRKKLVIVEGTYEEIKQKIETLESSFPFTIDYSQPPKAND